MKIINCNHCRSEIDRENLGEDIVCPVCGADISDLLLADIAATDQQSINTNHQSIYERHKSGVTASARRTVFALHIIILPLLSAAANGPEFIKPLRAIFSFWYFRFLSPRYFSLPLRSKSLS
ncbi:MAG: hypothetical protein IJ046_03145 [Clostridia bacterium]|nr:hypothetical protein [Clostridia bacterium]MBQ8915156.1 hypothetical protein [Clostridia bacterium]